MDLQYLVDGRIISVPFAWSWRLSEATPEQCTHYEVIGDDADFVDWYSFSKLLDMWQDTRSAIRAAIR